MKLGGPDPKNNPRLRLAILKSKEVNLPNEVVQYKTVVVFKHAREPHFAYPDKTWIGLIFIV